MSFEFTNRPISKGFYEPEGIYLAAPFEGRRRVIQRWGARPEHYRQWTAGGRALWGHDGLDFDVPPNGRIFAADRGSVISIGNDPARHGRFVRVAHSWGESLYTHLQGFVVEAGQRVERGALLGYFLRTAEPDLHFHFGLRIAPYDIADGWGGYADPLPHFPPSAIILSQT